MTRWALIREAMGVVKGAPADAVEDTEALYDDEPMVPFRHFSGGQSIPAVDVPGTRQWWQSRREECAAIVRRAKEGK